jgi:hypothetical protein
VYGLNFNFLPAQKLHHHVCQRVANMMMQFLCWLNDAVAAHQDKASPVLR